MKTRALNNRKADRPLVLVLRLLDDRQISEIYEAQEKSGLTRSAIIRSALNYFLPRFLKGDITLLELGRKP